MHPEERGLEDSSPLFGERFSLCRRLGKGGFGVVYHVFDRERGVHVALKRLTSQDPNMFLQFKKEFRALADLAHPHLVTLYELFLTQDACFFTMELVEGVPFTDFVRGCAAEQELAGWEAIFSSRQGTQGAKGTSLPVQEREAPSDQPLQTEPTALLHDQSADYVGFSRPQFQFEPTMGLDRDQDALHKPSASSAGSEVDAPKGLPHATQLFDEARLRHTLKQLVVGVHALHQAGKLHRDIKPSNILVTREGRLVILDFGLVVDTRQDDFASMVLAGTPAYMPPEREPSEAGDWYSVGVMLYVALTGRLPFDGPPSELLYLKRNRQPTPPEACIDGLPDDLAQLCRSLLSLDPKKRPSGEALLTLLGLRQDSVSVPSVSLSFLGREAALAQMQMHFEGVRQGASGILQVTGAPGIGKSALLARFREQLETFDGEQCNIFSVRCYEQESMPYRALDGLVDLLSRYLHRLPRLERASLLPHHSMGELLRLFPVLGHVQDVNELSLSQRGSADSREARRRAFSAFRDLFRGISQQKPLLLLLDDLQWMDRESAQLLNALIRPPDPPAFFLVMSYREEGLEENESLRALVEQIASYNTTHLLETIELAPLREQEAKILVGELLGRDLDQEQPEWLDGLLEEAKGNPLLLSTFVQYLRVQEEESEAAPLQALQQEAFPLDAHDPMELQIGAIVSAVLKRLAIPGLQLLKYLSIAEQPLQQSIVRRVMGESPGWVHELPWLRAHHLIRILQLGSQRALDVYHRQIRRLLLASMTEEERAKLHRELGRAFEEAGEGDPERKALHFYRAGEVQKALAYLSSAAKMAQERLAFSNAARLYSLALEWLDATEVGTVQGVERLTLLKGKADSYASVGFGLQAADAYLDAASLRVHGEAEALELRQQAADQLLLSGRVPRALELFAGIFGALGLKLPGSTWSTLVGVLRLRTQVLWSARKLTSTPLAPPLEQPSSLELQRVDACYSLAKIYGQLNPVKAAYFQSLHLTLALASGDLYRIALAMVLESAYRGSQETELSAYTRELRQHAVSIGKAINAPHVLAMAKATSGVVAFTHGRWQASYDLCSEAATIYGKHCHERIWERANLQVFRLNALLFMGQFRRLENELLVAMEEAEQRGDLFTHTFLSWGVLTKLRLAQDRPEDARALFAQVAQRWSHQPFDFQHYIGTLVQCEMALYQDTPEEALALLERVWGSLRQIGLLYSRFHRTELWHMKARAKLALAAQRDITPVQRRDLLTDTRRCCRRLRGMLWAAPLDGLLQAGLFTLEGERALALAALLKAHTQFEDLGMSLYAAVVLHCWGSLAAPEERERLHQRASEQFTQLGIEQPRHIIRMLAPGWWEL